MFAICLVALLSGSTCFNKNPLHQFQFPKYLIDYPYPDGNGTPDLRIADSLRYLGAYEQAAQQYANVLNGVGDNRTQHAYLLNQLVQLHTLMGQRDMAQHWQRQVHAKFGSTPQLDNAYAMGDYFYNLGEAAARENQIFTSKKYYLEALKFQKTAYGEGSAHYKLAQTYTALGEWYGEFNPDSSYVFIEKAAEIYDKWDKEPKFDHYKIRHTQAIAKMLYIERDYDLCVVTHEKAIDLAKRYLPMNPEFVAQCHFAAIAHLFENSSMLQKAEQYLHAGKTLLGNTPSDMGQQLYLNAKGDLLSNQTYHYVYKTKTGIIEDYIAKMELLYQEINNYYADDTKRPRHVFLNIMRANYYAHCLGQNSEAIIYYEKAYQQFMSDSMCNQLNREMIHHGVTESYMNLDDYHNAMKCAKRYILFGSKLENRGNIGWDSLLQPQILGNKHFLYVHYNLAGSIYLKKYSKSQNKEDLHRAYQIYCTIDTLIDRSLFSNSEESIIRIIQNEGRSIYGNAIMCAYLLNQANSVDKKYISNAFAFMEKQKAYLLRTKARRGFGKAPEGYQELIDKIQIAYQQKLRGGSSENNPWLTSLLKDLDEKYPNYNLINNAINKNSLEDVQKNLADKSAIVEYFLEMNSLFALVIKKDTVLLDKICSRGTLLDAIALTRRFYNGDTMATFDKNNIIRHDFAEKNPQLSKALLGGIYTHLRDADTLIIIRDKQINEVVFEALFDPHAQVQPNTAYSKMPFLVWRHNIIYSPSYWRHSRLENKNLTHPIRLQAFASKEFEWFLDSLKASMTKASILGQRQVVTKRAEFLGPLSNSKNRDMICIYAHGTGAKSADKAYLTFSKNLDIYGSEMKDIKLEGETVVLIACEGSQGQGQASEDIHTLTWYLQYAGAGTTISSYSKLQPNYGGEVLQSFYRNVNDGIPPDCSLCSAKRQYLKKHADKHESAPYYWATLVCSQ